MGRIFSIGFIIIVFIIAATQNELKANIDYLANQSADFYRTLSRNAATDAADIVNFNPAGTVFLKDGFHFNIANQTVYRLLYEMEYKGQVFKSEKKVPILPSVFAVFKSGNVAVFGAFTIPAGGGSIHYKDGISLMPRYIPKVHDFAIETLTDTVVETIGFLNPPYWRGVVNGYMDFSGTEVTFLDGEVKASVKYMAGTLGAAAKLTDTLSTAVAVRYMHAVKEMEGFATFNIDPAATQTGIPTDPLAFVAVPAAVLIVNGKADILQNVELDATKTASGFGFIVGFNWQPLDSLNLAVRYETATTLKWKEKVKHGKDFAGMFVDGRQTRYDLPMLIGVGINFSPFSIITFTASFNYYFVTLADTANDSYDDVSGYDDDYGNPFDFAIGVECRPFQWLTAGIGYMYTNSTGNTDTYSDLDFDIVAHAFSGGIRITPWEFLSITIGGNYVLYIEGHDATREVTYNKSAAAFAVGIEYRYLTGGSTEQGEMTSRDLPNLP